MTTLTFQDELNQHPIHIPRAALRMARAIAYPNLDVERYLARLDQLMLIAEAVVPQFGSPFSRAEALADLLFEQLGFRGNAVDYSDPRNSFLNEVLDRRLGIPISLSILYVYLANQLDIPAQGVGMPGHFIVRVATDWDDLFLDPFHGGKPLTWEDCASLVEQTTGYDGPFQVEWLQPTPPRGILIRMLHNLRGIYLSQKDWSHTIHVIELLRIIQPEVYTHLRDLGLAHYFNGSLPQAIYLLEAYLLNIGDEEDAKSVLRHLNLAIKTLSQPN